MEYPVVKRPTASLALIAFEALYGIMGIISGFLLISDPSGAGLGLTSDIREKIPFQTFLPVGLFLFSVYGIIPLFLAFGAVTRKEYAFEKVSLALGRHWSWTGGMILISILVLWLIFEGILIGLDWAATYFTALLGGAIFIMLTLPSTRKYYHASK